MLKGEKYYLELNNKKYKTNEDIDRLYLLEEISEDVDINDEQLEYIMRSSQLINN